MTHLLLASAALSTFACGNGAGSNASAAQGTNASGDLGTTAPPDTGTDPGISGLPKSWLDVHGAGAQRSDPKVGDRESTASTRMPAWARSAAPWSRARPTIVPQRPFVDLEDEVDLGDGLSDPEHGGRRGCHVSSQAESHGIWTRDDVVEAEAPLGVG